MSADNQNQNPPVTDENDKSKGKDVLNSQLAEVQEQLRAMNAQMLATQQAIADANRKPAPKQEEENLYDPTVVLQRAERIFDTKLKSEKAKDAMIWNLSEEYPEIRTKPEIRQAVLDAQKGVSEAIRDTAEGYEMAVLKAVQKAGLIPKSKRQTVEEDISTGPRGGGDSRTKPKIKVSNATLAAAELMGIDIEDKEVLKRLENHSNRNFGKYE